jgi:predicted transcriptional regulator
MRTITLRLPEWLHDRLRELAKQENGSVNQFITLALAEKIAATDYLQKRAQRGDRLKFERVLAKVADVEPHPEEPWQRLFESLDRFSDDYMEDRNQPAQQERREIFDPILTELWDNDLDAAYDTIQDTDSTSGDLDSTQREQQ